MERTPCKEESLATRCYYAYYKVFGGGAKVSPNAAYFLAYRACGMGVLVRGANAVEVLYAHRYISFSRAKISLF